MLQYKRREQILELLKRDGQVKNSELSKMFNVTEMTIRRDLDELAVSEEIIRTHGGGILPDDKNGMEPPYEKRIESYECEKKKIATKALSLIKPNQTVFLDSGTTTYYMADNIVNDSTNTVLTTGLNLAPLLLQRQNILVIMIGGNIRRNTVSSCGPLAEEQLNRFRVDIAFVGANGVGDDGKVYIGNDMELGIKKSVMNISKKKYLLVDSSKFGTSQFLCYSHMNDFDGIIVDDGLPEDKIKKFKKMGYNIIIA